jgi:hypothetical protein
MGKMPQESAAAFGMERAETPGYLHEHTETLNRLRRPDDGDDDAR